MGNNLDHHSYPLGRISHKLPRLHQGTYPGVTGALSWIPSVGKCMNLGASDNIATARRTRTSLRAQQQITSRYVSFLDPALLVDHATTGSRLIQRLLDALEGNHRGQNILYSAHRSVPHESHSLDGLAQCWSEPGRYIRWTFTTRLKGWIFTKVTFSAWSITLFG